MATSLRTKAVVITRIHCILFEYIFLEILCPTNISHGQLPGNCEARVNETCDNFTCDSGYQRNEAVDLLNCTDSGMWNYNTSTLCIGLCLIIDVYRISKYSII